MIGSFGTTGTVAKVSLRLPSSRGGLPTALLALQAPAGSDGPIAPLPGTWVTYV